MFTKLLIMNGLEIKKIREKNNMTQSELAELLNVSRGAVASWESGKRNIGFSTEQLLRQHLDGEADPNPAPTFTETELILFDVASFLDHKNMRQTDLAEALDISQPYVYQLKRTKPCMVL